MSQRQPLRVPDVGPRCAVSVDVNGSALAILDAEASAQTYRISVER
jgi:hypothetical protein